MRSLQDFAVDKKANIFVDAQQLPDFFKHNLLQSSRVVKVFKNDPQANIRVFYYQYLRLCFEVDDIDYEQYIHKIEDIINDPNFNFVFDQSEDPSVYNDLQFKQLLMEFFGLLGQGEANIQACLNAYPIMDSIFIYFFRSILILTDKVDDLYSYIDRMELFKILVQHFNVQIEIHDNCIRFPQTDIFVYEDHPQQVFMAYIGPQTSQTTIPISRQYVSHQASQELIQSPPISLTPVSINIQPTPQQRNLIAQKTFSDQKPKVKQSYIEEEFMDYTSNSPELHTLVKANKMKQSGDFGEYSKNKQNQKTSKPVEQTYKHSESFQPTQYVSSRLPEAIYKAEQSVYKPYQPPKPDSNSYHRSGFAQKNQFQQSYSAKSQYSDMFSATDHILNNILGKSNKYEPTPISKADQFTRYNFSNPATQDIDLESKSVISYTISETTKIPQVLPKQINNLSIGPQKSKQTNKFPTVSNTQINNFYTGDQFSNSMNYSASNNLNGYLPSNSSRFDNFNTNKLATKQGVSNFNSQIEGSFDSKKPFYNAVKPIQPQKSQKKNLFGLNISEEFTNSLTMKIMNQPYRSNVAGIRQRARNFRNSIRGFIN